MEYDLKTFRGDLSGGITTALVSLPLALAFGTASGLGAASGIYCAIALGFFVTVFGGTRTLMSGPGPPMTIAMTIVLTSHASSISEAFTVVILAGLLQILLGFTKLGRYVVYTPHMVVSGFMSGVGLLIILMQTLPFLGVPAAPAGSIGILRSLPDAVTQVNGDALIVAAITLAVAVIWPRRLTRHIPPYLLALLAGSTLGVLWFNEVPVIGEIPRGLPSVQFALPSVDFLISAAEPALILALLGSVDSLLACLVADSLTGTRHNPDRELMGQGIGNIVAGMIGGLPGSGGPITTMTNIRAGGTTRMSCMIRAVALLCLLMGLGQYIEPIPKAVLAGIMMKVGWDIIDWRMITRIHRLRPEHLIVMMVTMGLTVFVGLITAVAIGLIAAGMVHARQLERLELDSVVSVPMLDRVFFNQELDSTEFEHDSARVGLVALRGSFTVASSKKLVDTIGEDIKEHEVVIFDFTEAIYMDDSAAQVMKRLIDVAFEQGSKPIILGLNSSISDTLQIYDVLLRIPENHVVEHLDEARDVAASLLLLR